jgi:tetratricopeptide (TPR) repeat protein
MSAGLIAAVLLGTGTPPAPGADAPGLSDARRDALTHYGVAVWQAHRDRLLSAAKSLEVAAKQDPDATAPLKELVRVYAQIGREPDAIRAARRVLDKDPHDADTAHALARLLHDAGELKEAVAAAKLAAESPELADRPDKALAVYRDLAKLLDATGEPAAAADVLRKAVDLLTVRRKVVAASGLFTAKEIDAELADTHERLGKVLVKAAKFDAAADAYRAAHALYADRARANDPGSAARLDWNLSGADAARGDAAAALRHLEAFLKLRPQALEPYERLAAVLRQAGRGGEVVPALRRYADQDPKNLPLLAVLAAELAREPQSRPEADALFARLDPLTNDANIVRSVVRSHVETGRADRVLADLDRAYDAVKEKGEPGDPEKAAFAAAKARAIAAALKAEPEWANAIIRAAGEDLRQGVRRSDRTWHLTGVLAAWHHKLEVAAVQFRQAIRSAPRETQGDSYVWLIDVLRRSRKPAEVAAVCRDGLQRPDVPILSAFFSYHLAQALADLGDGAEALAVAEQAITQGQGTDSWRLETRLGKAWVLEKLGRYDDAVELCRKLADEFTAPANRPRVRYVLAGALWGAKKHAEAEVELRAILEAEPDHAGACNDLGYHLADRGRDLDEAERLVRRAIAADRADRRRSGDPEGENAAYLDSLGWVLFRKGDLAGAREWLERAAALPDGAADATVWDHLGDVYFRLGDKAKAKAHWDAALALYATDARAKRDGRPDEVKRKLKRVP